MMPLFYEVIQHKNDKKGRRKKHTLKIRAHPGASGFVGRHVSHQATSSGRARLKLIINLDETIRVLANIVFLPPFKT